MTKKKVLLLYITEVSGHHQATIAIERSLRSLAPATDVLNINGFGYTYPILEKVVNTAYMGVIKRTPRVWEYLYDNPKVVARTQLFKELINRSNHPKVKKLFEKFSPDVVACTQAFPCGMVADYKVALGLDFKLIGILTDYAPHSYWIHKGVDYYVVPADETKEHLVKKGVPPQKIKVLGIPIDQKFSFEIDKEHIHKKLGLDPSLPTILIMGGGHGLGPIKQIVKSLNALSARMQMVVLAGKNKKLMKWLKDRSSKFSKKILYYEFANNVEELMEISRLIITKPGGITTAEALVKGLPMVIVRPLPGQESHNTRFLLNQGIAIKIDDVKNVRSQIAMLIGDEERLMNMRQSAQSQGKPSASLDIAKLILE